MNRRVRWARVLALGVLSACGDSDGKPGYDPAYDCRQLFACAAEHGAEVTDGTEQECVEAGREGYRKSSAEARQELDAAHRACADETSCVYLDCMEDELGIGEEIVVPGGPDLTECSPELSPTQGEVATSVGAIPYSEADINFWVNDKGCLTEIDVELSSADCSIRFTADGLLDEEGRYLITEVYLSKSGLCPGYPETLSRSYRESAEDQPLGTITVTRPDESWHACHAGELVVRPQLSLSGFLDDPGIDLHGAEIRLTGNFNSTHWDPGDSCPVVFY